MAADWKKIKAEFIRGGVSYRKLADKYGVSFSTIQKVGASEKWTDLRKKSGRRAEEKTVELIASQEAEKAVDIEDTLREAAMILAGKIIDGLSDGTYVKASDVRDVTIAMKNLREIAGARARKDLGEQQARIDKLRHDTQDKDAGDNEIRIVISDTAKEYSE